MSYLLRKSADWNIQIKRPFAFCLCKYMIFRTITVRFLKKFALLECKIQPKKDRFSSEFSTTAYTLYKPYTPILLLWILSFLFCSFLNNDNCFYDTSSRFW